jgi:hypothetical protein
LRLVRLGRHRRRSPRKTAKSESSSS